MSRTFLLILVVATFQECSHAQEIFMRKTFGGVKFETDTLILSPRLVSEILQDEPLAYPEFSQARRNYNVAGVLGFAGGLMIALPVVSAIIGSDPQWGLAAGGAILILASVPLTKSFTLHAQRALDTHNKAWRLKTTVGFAGTGVRLSIKF
jgi:hypothetical protein